MELRVVTSTAIEAWVRMDCGGGNWKASVEDGREKGSARSFIRWAVHGKRKGSEKIGWD